MKAVFRSDAAHIEALIDRMNRRTNSKAEVTVSGSDTLAAVSGRPQDVMFIIGEVAASGEDSLVSVGAAEAPDDATNIPAIFKNAQVNHDAAMAAKKAMAAVMLRAFQSIMPSGTVLDLRFSRENLPPAHLSRVRTLRGNDRGTKVFRIVNVVSVEADPVHPDLSKWIADAVPISEKTGKDMKGTSHGADSRETVRLHGSVGCEIGLDEPTEKSVSRVIDLVAQHCGAAV